VILKKILKKASSQNETVQIGHAMVLQINSMQVQAKKQVRLLQQNH